MDYLLFRLYGALVSWGEIAVGESRHTANYPGKSAIIGLIGAALGIRRDDETRQKQIQQGYQLAVELINPGHLIRDYHTTQAPDSVGKFNYRTRRDELLLGKKRLSTILSSREYRSDAFALIALTALPDAPYSLEEIQTHLHKPKFQLYLGRKSCPLAIPLNPQIIQADHYFNALQAYQHKPILPLNRDDSLSAWDPYRFSQNKDCHYYWEGEAETFCSDTEWLKQRQTRVRYDQPLSRKRWQFSPRQEHYLYLQGET